MLEDEMTPVWLSDEVFDLVLRFQQQVSLREEQERLRVAFGARFLWFARGKLREEP